MRPFTTKSAAFFEVRSVSRRAVSFLRMFQQSKRVSLQHYNNNESNLIINTIFGGSLSKATSMFIRINSLISWLGYCKTRNYTRIIVPAQVGKNAR